VALPRAAADAAPRRGDVLVLADCPGPEPGGADTPRARFDRVRDGNPRLRFAVRLDQDPVEYPEPLAPDLLVLEIHWYERDKLPRPLTVSEAGSGGIAVRAVALANVVLADHGATVPADEFLIPARPREDQPYRPRLSRSGLAWVDPCSAAPGDAATGLSRPDPTRAVPALECGDGRRTWTARRDLLSSGRLAADVVVELDEDGSARLRFGDGVNGRRPGSQSSFTARYRIGGGTRGNVAADRLGYLTAAAGTDIPSGADIAVWNPLPAAGGTDPEDIERIRRLAPAQFRRTGLRAVTRADHEAIADQTPGVQRSVARRHWTGTWYAQEVTLDLTGGETRDDSISGQVRDALNVRRMAGVDVEVTRTAYAALWIALTVRVSPGSVRPVVAEQVAAALSPRSLPGGGRGFFHPDNFTFGQPLYVSDLVVAVMAVAGVDTVEVTRFGRLTDPPPGSGLASGRIAVYPREVVRCDSDPEQPEAGWVDLYVVGGS
jgi:hypothetical protein